MAKKSTKRRILVGALIVVGLLALIIGLVGRPTTNLASTLLTEPVTTGDVAVDVSGSGTIVDQYTYSIAPGATPVLLENAGTVVSAAGANSNGYHTSGVFVAPGTSVTSGEEIFEVKDKNDVAYAVTAPWDATIRSVTTAVGAATGQVATIGTGGELVSVQVSEHDVAKVAAGQTVSLTLGATKAVITGTVKSIGQLGDNTTGVEQYTVLIAPASLPATSRIGMSVTASIEISSAKNVLYVSPSAITTANGVSTVKVLENNRIRLVPVTLGVIGDSRVEIKSGLTAGEVVVSGASGTVPVVTTGTFPRGGN